jgi:RimJ/RimL family protein N-acetyltransferase
MSRVPVSSDRSLPCVAALRDGTAVTLRLIRPSDAAGLRDGFHRLSPATRYLRLHAHVSDLTDEQLHYLTAVDGIDHCAIVAEVSTRVVGVARLIRSPEDRAAAEIAFVVVDALQRRGLGGLLRDALLALARERGITRLVANVLRENVAIRRLLAAHPLALIADTGDALVLELAQERAQ